MLSRRAIDGCAIAPNPNGIVQLCCALRGFVLRFALRFRTIGGTVLSALQVTFLRLRNANGSPSGPLSLWLTLSFKYNTLFAILYCTANGVKQPETAELHIMCAMLRLEAVLLVIPCASVADRLSYRYPQDVSSLFATSTRIQHEKHARSLPALPPGEERQNTIMFKFSLGGRCTASVSVSSDCLPLPAGTGNEPSHLKSQVLHVSGKCVQSNKVPGNATQHISSVPIRTTRRVARDD